MFSIDDVLGGRPARLTHLLDAGAERAAKSSRGAIIISDDGECLSYAQLVARVAGTAAQLAEHGVRAGDRVLLVIENSIEAVVLFFAVQRLEAWPVMVNARMTTSEISGIQNHCRPRAIVFLSAASPAALSHAGTFGAAELGPVHILAGLVAEPEIWGAGSEQQFAAMIYTSGSTGQPKGVMLSHRNLLFNAAVVAQERGYCPDDTLYGLAPMSHSLGLGGLLLPALLSGARYQAVARFDAKAFLDMAMAGEVTILNAPPAAYLVLSKVIADGGSDLSAAKLRVLGVGSAPLDALLKARVEAAFGQPLHNGYGITETGPSISFSRPKSPAPGLSVGSPLPHVQVKVVDAAGMELASGEEGELWVRSPGNMLGYYRDEAATAAAMRTGGWFTSGDIASLDGDGNLYILGRLKELIIRSGFNVYPAEIENVLNDDATVAASAVIGVPDDEGGTNEAIMAYVQPAVGMLVDTERLAGTLRDRLSPYKQPREIRIMEQLPQTSTGKVLKARLK